MQHLSIILLCLNFFKMAVSQAVFNGCYGATFPGQRSYVLCIKDDSIFFTYHQYDSKGNEKNTINKNLSQRQEPLQVSIDHIDYVLSPRNTSHEQIVVLRSNDDSVMLFQDIKTSSEGRIIWEIRNEKTLYKESGGPADYEVFYFDSSDVESYPSYPIAIAKFRNGRKCGREVIFYSIGEVMQFEKEQGEAGKFSSSGCCWVKEKRKWTKGILKSKIKKYKPGERFV